MLRNLVEKEDSVQEQMGSVSREVGTNKYRGHARNHTQ